MRFADDRGQALVVVAASAAVLIGALALALDWGFGLTQRRVAQNVADAAALGAARSLATSLGLDGDLNVEYRMSEEQVSCVAREYAEKNATSFVPSDRVSSLLVQIGDGTADGWTTLSDPPCPFTETGTTVPSSVAYVRVVASTTYRSLLASVVGRADITASASARARIMGMTGSFPVWPMVRHYDPQDFVPTAGPFTFWSSSGSDDNRNMVFGSFKGLVDYSKYSPRILAEKSAKEVAQLITKSDARYEFPGVAADESSKCPAGWDSKGDEDPENQDKRCSIPNWAFYAFGGDLSLDTDWSHPGEGREAPSDIGDRPGVCEAPLDGLMFPSCGNGNSTKGDWVETAPNGDLGKNISTQMRAFIDAHGFTTDLSDQLTPDGKTRYGKAVVIDVYLWDCAESFDANQKHQQWTLEKGAGGDCSQIAGRPGAQIDRVHLLTAAPFTFYEGLISTSKVEGFWGGAFGDPKWCAAHADACGAPNAFTNTAFLVPDE